MSLYDVLSLKLGRFPLNEDDTLIMLKHYKNKKVEYTNLLGSIAGCESATGWSTYHPGDFTLTTDSDNKIEGANCLKMTMNIDDIGSCAYKGFDYNVAFYKDKYYLLSGYIKNFNMANGMQIAAQLGGTAGRKDSAIITGNKWTRVGVILQPLDFDGATVDTFYFYVRVPNTGANNGQYGYFDACMLNEIIASDYAQGLDYCLNKYPFKL